MLREKKIMETKKDQKDTRRTIKREREKKGKEKYVDIYRKKEEEDKK